MTKNDQRIQDLEARIEKLESENRNLTQALCDLIAKMPQQPIYIPYFQAQPQPLPWPGSGITWTWKGVDTNVLDDVHVILSDCAKIAPSTSQ
jgi:hypothetical protein